MSRSFIMFGAILGMVAVPLASIAGGFYGMVRYGFREGVALVERNIISKVEAP